VGGSELNHLVLSVVKLIVSRDFLPPVYFIYQTSFLGYWFTRENIFANGGEFRKESPFIIAIDTALA
jgi:hypothetical protein